MEVSMIKKTLFILTFLASQTIFAGPWGTDWLRIFGPQFKVSTEEKNKFRNPALHHGLAALAYMSIMNSRLPQQLSSLLEIDQGLVQSGLHLSFPSTVSRGYGWIADKLAPQTTLKEKLEALPDGAQRFAKTNLNEQKKRSSCFIQTTANVVTSIGVLSISGKTVDETIRKCHLDEPPACYPINYLYGTMSDAIGSRIGKEVDLWFHPYDDTKTAHKMSPTELQETARVVPSVNDTTPEAEEWRRCGHLCKEDLLKIAEERTTGKPKSL